MPTKSKIQDQTFLFTGTLTEFTRDEAEAFVEGNGGKVLSGVSAKLNYLIVGEDAGSKLEKAKKLGTVKILTEKEFLKMVPKGNALAKKPSSTKVIKPAATKKATVKEKTKPTVSKTIVKKVAIETNIEEIKIGNQVWMTKNLRVEFTNSGEKLNVKKLKCDPSGDKFGFLYHIEDIYNFYDEIAPDGWKMPLSQDWYSLEATVIKNSGLLKKWKESLYSNYKEKGINELLSETHSNRFWNGYAYIPDGEDEICAEFVTIDGYDKLVNIEYAGSYFEGLEYLPIRCLKKPEYKKGSGAKAAPKRNKS
jgi:uncharacterized protein (TIGR02145 family)